MNVKSGYNDRTLMSYCGDPPEGESTCWYSLTTGGKHWQNNEGQLHRLHGPAVELPNGTKGYWIHGKKNRVFIF